jgi:SpoVK/Ycf46/Vps4 family AAA+-type ATPase
MDVLLKLNDQFKKLYEEAVLFQQQGKLDDANLKYILAAETMFELANKGPESLKIIRIEKAKTLIKIVEELKPSDSKPQVIKNSNEKNQEEVELEFKPQTQQESITFNDIIGLDEAKFIVNTQLILPIKYPDMYKMFKKNIGGGMILYGPPGTGKTTFAKAIANEADASFFYIKGSDILDKFVGESQKKIAALFDSINKVKRAVLFVDDMDSLFMKRGIDHHNDERVNEFLQQMDGFHKVKAELMLLGATNRPWALDSAITRPGRFSRQVYIGLPNFEARIYLTKKYILDVPLDQSFSFEQVSKQTENFSGADIKELCEQAKLGPLMRSIYDEENNIQHSKHVLTNEDFFNALKNVSSSINLDELNEFEMYKKN